jgi:Ca2+-binding EF-hand superfamily protein
MYVIRCFRLTCLALGSLFVPSILAQPGPVKGGADQKPRLPVDEFRTIHKEVAEAYKAPDEVDKNVLDELRKQYQKPSADREARILRQIRRLYRTNPQLEDAIQDELHRAYENPSHVEEARVLAVMRRGGELPLGTVSVQELTEKAAGLFHKLDQNRDGFLSPDEMSDELVGQYRRWDLNHDGAVSLDEYVHYYHAYLNWVADGVASGEIPLKLGKGGSKSETTPVSKPVKTPRLVPPEAPPKVENKPVPLPAWFAQLDTDGDGQIGLYEWKAAGRRVADFVAMDRNGDGYLEADEVRQFLTDFDRLLDLSRGSSRSHFGQ